MTFINSGYINDESNYHHSDFVFSNEKTSLKQIFFMFDQYPGNLPA